MIVNTSLIHTFEHIFTIAGSNSTKVFFSPRHKIFNGKATICKTRSSEFEATSINSEVLKYQGNVIADHKLHNNKHELIIGLDVMIRNMSL